MSPYILYCHGAKSRSIAIYNYPLHITMLKKDYIMILQRVKKYQTSLGYLVRNGLVGEQACVDACYPPQDNLRDSVALKSFVDETDSDFDPIQIDYDKALESAYEEFTKDNVEPLKTE